MSNTKDSKRMTVRFAAIDPYLEENIVRPTERKMPGKEMVEWGTKNAYPDYLLDLYNTTPTLRSIVNGNVDFVTGDDVTILPLGENFLDGVMNRKGDTIRGQVHDLAKDFEIYGGFALQVIRNYDGEVAEINYIDMRFLRTNKECNVFWYCEDWQKTGAKKIVEYPAFMPDLDWLTLDEDARERQTATILFVKNINTQVYPSPLYAASVKACEIERSIDDYHLNAINNGFVSSMIVNFNNGIPEDEQMEEIEKTFNEKFSGHQNAGRIMFSWNKSKETATEIVTPTLEDFGEKYEALAKHSRQQIFTAFRANPNLFGIPTENLGFSSEEYDSAFRLYNRTQIKPVQRTIADTYDKIYGTQGVLSIVPFTLNGAEHKIS